MKAGSVMYFYIQSTKTFKILHIFIMVTVNLCIYEGFKPHVIIVI